MKTLYTSYFARASKHPRAISISAKSPPGFPGRRIVKLAPTWDMLRRYKNDTLGRHSYAIEYLNKLRGVPDTVAVPTLVQDVADLFEDGDVMLCYEKTGSFCHRHIIAALLNESGTAEVYELDENLQPHKRKITFEDVVRMFEGDIQWEQEV